MSITYYTREELLNAQSRGFRLGQEDENHRIIKLLEGNCERPLDPKWEHYRESCSCWQIALIKEEK